MLTCVPNIAEGRDARLLHELDALLGPALLDRHSDAFHHRSVFTLGGSGLLWATERLARRVVDALDLERHAGAHPRLGVLDVVPFAPVGVPLGPGMDLTEALSARDRFAAFAASELGLPCFLYGPERSLPEIRRRAFRDLRPDLGPSSASARSGAVCVGARPPLVAYNCVLAEPDLALARAIAKEIRSPALRALGLAVGASVQVSMNLIAPWEIGPAEAYDLVATKAAVARAELVGLVPRDVLAATPVDRWPTLDLAADRSVEARLELAGWC